MEEDGVGGLGTGFACVTSRAVWLHKNTTIELPWVFIYILLLETAPIFPHTSMLTL